jgi:hypothetical protein
MNLQIEGQNWGFPKLKQTRENLNCNSMPVAMTGEALAGDN